MKRKSMFLAIFLQTFLVHAAVQQSSWGSTADGQKVSLFVLSNSDLRVQLTNYGARIVSIEAPDRKGVRANVALGHNNLAAYTSNPKDYLGAIVGRYGNRIAKGTFQLQGKGYQVPINNYGNALHGGPRGFSTRVWQAHAMGDDRVEFTLMSPDGDMGFPGALLVHVRYTLSGKSLRIDYTASTNKLTVLNLTNHTYFNLRGEASGDVLQQRLVINADSFTPVDAALIPTGILQSVKGTPFDFREVTSIGDRINVPNEQLKRGGGYDHNFVLIRGVYELHKAAVALDPESGRTLTVLTTEPGVQFYSGNSLNGTAKGYAGTMYAKHAGFCLETQHFPDSPNHANFPSTQLLPGQTFRSTTVFVFGVAPRGL
ncbi:aldose epimerase family protein [Terriglobus saanensis]|nr:aldose epimerase family protein [Terriglobus saanensis]